MADNPNMGDLMKLAQQMQDTMKSAHDQLQNAEYTGESGGGIVKVTMNGRHDIKRIEVSDDAYNQGKDMLLAFIKSAANAAVQKIEKAAKDKMLELSKDLGVPSPGEGEKDDDNS